MEKENRNRMHMKPNAIKYTKGYAKKRFFSKMLNIFLSLFIVGLVIAIILVYLKQPVKTEDGYLTSVPTYDIIEHGQKVLVVEDKKSNFLTPLKRAVFNQKAYYGKIIAGPYGEIQQTNGKYRVSDGTQVISIDVSNPPEYLDFQYVVREIDESGEFVKGKEDSVLNKDEVLGKVFD